jgi:hypothetical protein
VARLLVAAEREDPDGPKYWDQWPKNYDYVYLLFTESDADNPDPAHLTLLQDGTNFQLYRVNSGAAASRPQHLSAGEGRPGGR